LRIELKGFPQTLGSLFVLALLRERIAGKPKVRITHSPLF
jgi:hypothetical protein